MPTRQLDPDDGLVAIFKTVAMQDDRKTVEAGRPIFDDVDVCEIRYAGSRDIHVFPALSASHWVDDGLSARRQISFAERFSRQYKQFKENQHQTKSGTPLDYLTFLTEARRAELRALNIYTAEALAGVEGNELKNLGPGGRDMKNQALAYLETSTDASKVMQLEAKIEAMMAQNMTLQQDLDGLRQKQPAKHADYEHMTDDQLRSHVASITGVEPKGNLPRRTLIRMAEDHKVPAVA